MSDIYARVPADARYCELHPGECAACDRGGLGIAVDGPARLYVCFGCLEAEGDAPFEEAVGLILWRVRRARDLG